MLEINDRTSLDVDKAATELVAASADQLRKQKLAVRCHCCCRLLYTPSLEKKRSHAMFKGTCLIDRFPGHQTAKTWRFQQIQEGLDHPILPKSQQPG
jgi:hypothetical protein